MMTLPPSGSKRPARIFKIVDFPAPLWPTSAVRWKRSTCHVMSPKIFWGPKYFVSPETCIITQQLVKKGLFFTPSHPHCARCNGARRNTPGGLLHDLGRYCLSFVAKAGCIYYGSGNYRIQLCTSLMRIPIPPLPERETENL